MTKQLALTAGFLCALTVAGGAAWGEAPSSGASVLTKADEVVSASANFRAVVELDTVETDGQKTSRTLQVWQKGHGKRMVKITAPPRLRGVGILSKDDDALYLYLPAFGKTRRVAGRKRGERFFGSNFTQDDLSRTRYGHRFRGTLVAEDDATWTLRLDPKNPEDEPTHHLIITVRKADHGISEVKDFDTEKGGPIRTVSASDFRVVGGILLAHTITCLDTSTQSRSTATLGKVEPNADLADSFLANASFNASLLWNHRKEETIP